MQEILMMNMVNEPAMIFCKDHFTYVIVCFRLKKIIILKCESVTGQRGEFIKKNTPAIEQIETESL